MFKRKKKPVSQSNNSIIVKVDADHNIHLYAITIDTDGRIKLITNKKK